MTTILTDIIGTTTPMSYAFKLGADFRQYGAEYVKTHPEFSATIEKVTAEQNLTSTQEAIDYICTEINVKRNFKPEYMALCGAVNTESLKKGRLNSEFFSDVPETLRHWKKGSEQVYAFSSGSEELQKEMFAKSEYGDISTLVDGFFDTAKAGSKKIPESYEEVCKLLNVPTSHVIFLSDDKQELDAAMAAGLETYLVVRPGKEYPQQNAHKEINSFTALLS